MQFTIQSEELSGDQIFECSFNNDHIKQITDSSYELNKTFINDFCNSFNSNHILLSNGTYEIRSKNIKINDVLFKKIVTKFVIAKETRIDFNQLIINSTSQNIIFNSGTKIMFQLEINNDFSQFLLVPKIKSIHDKKELTNGYKLYNVYIILP